MENQLTISEQWRLIESSVDMEEATFVAREKKLESKDGEMSVFERNFGELLNGMKEKQERLNLWERRLSEREKALEVVEVGEIELFFRRNSEDLGEMEVKNGGKLLELREKEFDVKSAVLESRQKGIDEKCRLIEWRRKVFKRRFSELEERKKEFDDRCRLEELRRNGIDVRFSVLEGKEKELDDRCRLDEMREKDLATRFSVLESRDKEIDEKCRLQVLREKGFETGFNVLESRRKEIDEKCRLEELREKEFEKRFSVLEAREKEFDEKCRLEESRRKEIDVRCSVLESREKEFDDRCRLEESWNKEIDCRFSMLESKEFDGRRQLVESWRKEIDARFSALESKEKEFDDRCRLEELREKEFENRFSVLESREKELHVRCRSEDLRKKEIDARFRALEAKEKEIDVPCRCKESRKEENDRRLNVLEGVEVEMRKRGEELDLREKTLTEISKNIERNLRKRKYREFCEDLEELAQTLTTKELKEIETTEGGINQISNNNDATGAISCRKKNSRIKKMIKVLKGIRKLPDPPKFVLEHIQRVQKKGFNNMTRDGCTYCLISLIKLNPDITVCVREEAKVYAQSLRSCAVKKDSSPIEILYFLQYVASYSLYNVDEFLLFLQDSCNERGEFWPDEYVNFGLSLGVGLSGKASVVIWSLIKGDRHLEAVLHICAFKKEDVYPIEPKLNAHLESIRKRAREILTGDSITAQDDAANMELAALGNMLKCISYFKLESRYSAAPLRLRITQLEKEIEESVDWKKN